MLNTLSNWLYRFMVDLTDSIFGAPDFDSNESLRRWLDDGGSWEEFNRRCDIIRSQKHHGK